MFSRPEIGKAITVTSNWSDHTSYMVYSTGRQMLTGIVVVNPAHVDPNSFCLKTINPNFPMSAIPLARVVELKYHDGSEATTEEAVMLPDMETWTVDGSTGQYIVTRSDTTWSCECKGYMFRGSCKHINEKKQEVIDRK